MEKTILQPGDSVVVGPYGEGEIVAVSMVSALPADAKPFFDADGKQDWPRVEIHKPKGSGPE